MDMFVIGLVALETILISMALVPPQLWTRLLPQTSAGALDGPFPPVVAPAITMLFYVVPTAIGFFSRRWQQALFYATIPAWIALGIFLVAATSRVGIFYLVSVEHVTANVSTLELFALLGGIGWFARFLFKIR
jgi:hypothetical protein